MAAYITFMGAEGGSNGGRLIIKVKEDYTDVGKALERASGYVEFSRANGKPVLVNPAAVAFIAAT